MAAKKTILILSLIIIFTSICSTAEAKSVFIISSHDYCLAEAFSINSNGVSFQAMVDVSTYNSGIGPVGVAVWPQKMLAFFTYEDSSMIVWSSTNTLEKVGELDTDIYNLAGIAVDNTKQKIYVIQRQASNLYVYSWDVAQGTIVLDSNYVLGDGLGSAFGLALDESNSRLYVSDNSKTVRYYNTNTWAYQGSIDVVISDVDRPAVGIAVDPVRGYLYTGNFYGTGSNHTNLVRTMTASPYTSIETNIGYPVIGIDVDKATGLVYCTTHVSDFRVYDSNLTLLDTETNNNLESPAGVAVGGYFNSLKITKVDDVNNGDCVGPGRQITYTIDYNYPAGPNLPNINDVNIIDYLPPEVDFNSASNGGVYNSSSRIVTWHIGTLHPGDFGSVTLTVEVNSPEPGGTITNYCEIKSGDEVLYIAYEYTHVCWRIIYADKDANGVNNGTSWKNAYNYLQDALQDANISPGYKEIWVADGNYMPDCNWAIPNGTGVRTAAFRLINGVKIKGGFAGYGAPDPNVRDTNLYKTILSGDIGTPDVNTDNSYHVVTADGVDETAMLDGFTITAGDANGSWPYNSGGGMYNHNGSPVVTDCIFTENIADVNGGGMYNKSSNPTITNCIFSGNLAGYGGGISDSNSSPKITNCTFTKNTANANGGGICNKGSNPMIINCILWGNTAPNNPQIYNYNNSSPAIAYSDIQGGLPPAGWDPADNNDPNLLFNMNFEVYNNTTHTTTDAKAGRVGTLHDYNPANPNVFGELGKVGHDANFAEIYDASPGPGISKDAPWASQPNDCKIMFQNTGGLFDLGDPYPLSLNHTWAFWFKKMDMTNGTMIRHANLNLDPDTGSPDLVWEMRLSDGKLQFYHKNGSLRMETASNMTQLNIAPDVWHHAAFIIDRTNCYATTVPTTSQSAKIFIDGLEVPIIVTAYNILSMNVGPGFTGYLMIGAGEKEFEGSLDEIRLYNRSLTPLQVSLLAGAHNINADPCFVNPAQDNYRLLSNSPCIDTGNNSAVPPGVTTDLDGLPRFIDGDFNGTAIVDMGAYEFRCLLIGDLNNDCKVDFKDLKIMADNWLGSGPTADIVPPPSGDGRVNFKDFAVLAENWLIDCRLIPSNPACVPK